jgi:hypothetical protein
MLEIVEAQLNECVYLHRSVGQGPQRANQIRRLRALLTAQKALVRAIEGLDEWSWFNELWPQIDQERCALPDAPGNTAPEIPIAVTALGEAVEVTIEELRKRPRDKTGYYPDDAIKGLAEAFHDEASPELAANAYRAELLGEAATRTPGFIAIALKAARLHPPEPRKIWARIPEQFQTKKETTVPRTGRARTGNR